MSIDLDREALAWAAGFYDGEGSVGLSGPGGRYPQLRISQCHPEVLQRFRLAVGGIGFVTGPHPRPAPRQDVWVYRTSGMNAQAVAAMLWPFLSSVKRAQFRDVTVRVQNLRAAS